jgi:MoaA/NifB/PqqE/SkfB family radical SAM enzyme
MTASGQSSRSQDELPRLESKHLWVYTNYDCNLACPYCLARSTPKSSRREITLDVARQIVDEGLPLGFERIFFTGGEPFVLDEIDEILAYASAKMDTIVLTNAMLFTGSRLEKLKAIQNDRLTIQVSLDGATPEQHDPYRGAGSWAKTVDGIHVLLDSGFTVKISTTETPANSTHLDDICAFHLDMGISEENHIIRPLARRGFAEEGMEVGMTNIQPELTIDCDGAFWHPISTDEDMQVNNKIFPLADAVQNIRQQLDTIRRTGTAPPMCFT